MLTQPSTRRAEFFGGVRAILPLVIGSIPFAIIFGALAVTNGLSTEATVAMSAIVFAGSAQFVAISMVAAGANLWVIILTTLIINLRHMLYAAAIAPHLKHLTQRWLVPLGFTLTDESFVVAIQRYNRDDNSRIKHWYHFGTTAALYINWQLSTWIGLLAGRAIPNPAAWGLDFAFPATFIGMLVPMVISRSIVACVVSAGVATVVCYGLPNKLGLIFAALSGVAAGMAVEQWFPAAVHTTVHTPADHTLQSATQRANKP